MTFSLFTGIFLLITTAFYYILRKELRPYVLLAASLVYVFLLDQYAGVWLLVSAALTYVVSLLTDMLARRGYDRAARFLSFVFVLWCVATLALMKLTQIVSSQLTPDAAPMPDLLRCFLLPVGFSYYIFQSVSFLRDIRTGKARAEKNPVYVLLYLCFFPKFISGPIERADHIMPQLRALSGAGLVDEGRIAVSLTGLLYGYFLKTVVADRMALYIYPIFTGYREMSAFTLMLGSLLYTIRLYADFAGYSAIGVAVARLFGMTLVQNFHAPYLSESITEFWRRWHMSLSSFLRDYLYIPLGGNRLGTKRKCINLLIVFAVCGLWHGNGVQFVVWGLLHGLYCVIDTLVTKRPASAASRLFARACTFCAVSFAWIFFGSASLTDALRYISRMLSAFRGVSFQNDLATIGMNAAYGLLFLFGVFALLVSDIISYRLNEPFPESVQRQPYILRYLFVYALIILILVFGRYGPGFDASRFMYMEF